jgi:hypothetical protein
MLYPRNDMEVIMRLLIRLFTALAFALALTLPGGGAVAAPAVVERTEDFTTAAFDSCSGQFVTLTGTFHVVTKQNADGSSTQRVTFNARGTGEDGTEYLLNETQTTQTVGSDVVLDDHNVLVSGGAAPNQMARVHIDAAGEVTAEIRCAG